MSNARDIIIRPIVTEKTMRMTEADNKVTFEVAKNTNKVAISEAIKEIYNITPVSVNVVNVKSKTKRVGRYVGKTKSYKKAIVKLPAGQEIAIFDKDR